MGTSNGLVTHIHQNIKFLSIQNIFLIFLLKERIGQNKVSGLAIVNYPEKFAPDDKHLQTTIGPW